MEDAKYEKFVTAMQLMDIVIKLTAEYRASIKKTGRWTIADEYKADTRAIHEAWDELYSFIHTNFARPESARIEGETWSIFDSRVRTDALDHEGQMCWEMLSIQGAEELLAKIKAIPPIFAEVLFPVAIARHLLRDVQAPLYPARLTTFTEFHYRYGPMICDSRHHRK